MGKVQAQGPAVCPLCGRAMGKADVGSGKTAICPDCVALLARAVREQPELLRELWAAQHGQPPAAPPGNAVSEPELPEVLDARRYRTIDRDGNKWYLSVSELNGRPVEVFASTAFDRDHELQSRIANLTTITRLISMVLRYLSLGETLTYEKCLKQIQRSSRQKDDLPDMLVGVLGRYVISRTGEDSAEKEPC